MGDSFVLPEEQEYTLDQLLTIKPEDLQDGLYTITLSKIQAQESGFDIRSFLEDGDNVLFTCTFNEKKDRRFLVSDKDGLKNRDLSTILNTIYYKKYAGAVLPPQAPWENAAETVPPPPKSEDKKPPAVTTPPPPKPEDKKPPVVPPPKAEEPAPREEELEDEDSPLTVCDRRLTLQDFVLTPIEDLPSRQLICVEDRNDDFQMVPDEKQGNFIFYKGKVYFFVMLDITKVGGKVTSFKLAVLENDGSVNKVISQNLTQFYKEFQEKLIKIKGKGARPVTTTTKKGVRIELTERVFEEGDTDEIKALRKQLYDTMDNLKRLQAGVLEIDLQLPEKPGYTPLNKIIPDFFQDKLSIKLDLLHIIPFELFERFSEYYYVKDDILEFAKSIFAKKDTLKDYDPTYVIKDDFDRQMIMMEQIRRHFFEIKIKELKKNYLQSQESIAANKFIEILDANKDVDNETLKSMIKNKYDMSTDSKEKNLFTIIYTNFESWKGKTRDILVDIASKSPLNEKDTYFVEHDEERIAEENDMSKPNSAYPNSFEGFNAIALEEGTVIRPHYHKFINKEGLKTGTHDELSQTGEYMLPISLKLAIQGSDFMEPINCTRFPDLDCKRPYTFYHLWRIFREDRETIQSVMKESFRIAYEGFFQPFLTEKDKQLQQKQDDLNRNINNIAEAIKNAFAAKQAKDAHEKVILTEINKQVDQANKVYQAQIDKQRILENFGKGKFEEYIYGGPNNLRIFCPYCAGFIEERKPGSACRFYYENSFRGHHDHHLKNGKLLVGENNINEKRTEYYRDVCGICNGPVNNHDHYYLDTGTAPNSNAQDYCIGVVDRRKGGRLDVACLHDGGGGILEGIARHLAYRDVIKMKITTNPPENNFGITYEELAVLADIYARIIRIDLGGGARISNKDKNALLTLPMPASIKGLVGSALNNLTKRVNTIYTNNQWEDGPRPLDILRLSAFSAPNRAEIEARVRAAMGSGPQDGPKPPPKTGPKPPTPPPGKQKTKAELQAELAKKQARLAELQGIYGAMGSANNSTDIIQEITEITGDISMLETQIATFAGGSSKKVQSNRRTYKVKKHYKRKTRITK